MKTSENRIREQRKAKGMTQVDLARALQIADTTLGYWERGIYEPSREMLLKMSEIFGVSVDYLLGKEVNKDEEIKIALFGGDTEVTDEMWQEVKQFAEYVKSKNSNK